MTTPARCVYHLVPANLAGSVLYPLNRLKEIFPEVAAAHVKKYEGREGLLNTRIPLLDSLWNDVLHLSPVHPAKITAAMREAGHLFRPRKWYGIDATLLSASDTVIWEYPQRERARGDFTVGEDEVLPFASSLLDNYSEVGEGTRRYYASNQPGQPFLRFVGITHILYKGCIDVADIRVIEG